MGDPYYKPTIVVHDESYSQEPEKVMGTHDGDDMSKTSTPTTHPERKV